MVDEIKKFIIVVILCAAVFMIFVTVKFDENNKNDLNKLSIWKEKSKESDYYKQAIYTWTNLDVRKRNIAKENNLNYLEIFTDNLDECITVFEEYLSNIS